MLRPFIDVVRDLVQNREDALRMRAAHQDTFNVLEAHLEFHPISLLQYIANLERKSANFIREAMYESSWLMEQRRRMREDGTVPGRVCLPSAVQLERHQWPAVWGNSQDVPLPPHSAQTQYDTHGYTVRTGDGRHFRQWNAAGNWYVEV